MNAVWNSYGQLCGCPEIFKKSCKFFCRELDIRVTQIVEANMPQIVFGKQLWKSRSEIVGRDKCPHFVHTNIFQIPFVIALPTYSSVFRLLFFQLQ